MKLPPGIAWLLAPRWPALAFALRTTVTSLVALAIAFLMDMDDPGWAATTVWIVAQPERGMSLAKARARILGTLTGAAVALALAATCIQTPELFLSGLAIWIGICTGIATLLRNFRAYSAVLAGYTAAMIAIGAASQPENVFDIAIARLLYVLLGILCETVATSILTPGSAARGLDRKIRLALSRVAAASSQALRGKLQPGPQMGRLVSEINALDTAAEYAAAASSEIDRHSGHIRQIITSLLIQLSAAHSTSRRIARTPLYAITHQRIARAQAEAKRLFDEIPGLLDRLADKEILSRVRTLRQSLAVDQPLTDEGKSAAATQTRFLLDRLDVILRSLEQELVHLIGLKGDVLASRGRTVHHRDVQGAWINGVRATLSVCLASFLWIASAWQDGGSFVIIVAVVCALFATRDNPVAGSLAFLKGTAVAVLPAAVATFIILPKMSGFAMLALGIGPFLFLGGLAYFSPYAGMAAAGSIFFWNMIEPENLARQTATGFFNSAISLLVSMAFASLCFHLFLPVNPARRRKRLLAAVVRDLAQPLTDPYRSTHTWARRMADRIARAGPTVVDKDPDSERPFANLLAALDLGIGGARLARIRHEQELPAASLQQLDATIRRLREMAQSPQAAVDAAAATVALLRRLAPSLPPRQAMASARALEATEEVAERLLDHPDLFDPSLKRP
ncbi:Uncharacterized membrane protein YccC [Arboricoccus pini]|uniref:Uncharacterized membrane protein YccC n=1 Tax=Arboricoccus pini TaxID=1963835 RepID=A0A212QX05_9PROT|nr:FUSC family protein [Arboricoccus pini]SNB64242.1 Uncharacterized membrane protein YccC [Arboricoccus pini]